MDIQWTKSMMLHRQAYFSLYSPSVFVINCIFNQTHPYRYKLAYHISGIATLTKDTLVGVAQEATK